MKALGQSHLGSGPSRGSPGEIIAVRLLLVANTWSATGKSSECGSRESAKVGLVGGFADHSRFTPIPILAGIDCHLPYTSQEGQLIPTCQPWYFMDSLRLGVLWRKRKYRFAPNTLTDPASLLYGFQPHFFA